MDLLRWVGAGRGRPSTLTHILSHEDPPKRHESLGAPCGVRMALALALAARGKKY